MLIPQGKSLIRIIVLIAITIILTNSVTTNSVTVTVFAYAFSFDDLSPKNFDNYENLGMNLLKGPEGDKGDPGPPGPRGEKGDKGDPGPSQELETITVSKILTYGIGHNEREVFVGCPDGSKVTGGGYEKTQNFNKIEIYENKPQDNGWMVKFQAALLSDAGDDYLTVYAQCAKLD